MIQQTTGIKAQRHKGTEEKTCRICRSSCAETSLQFNERTLARCATCGVMQVKPFPSDEEIRSFYIHENFASENGARFKGLAERMSVFFRKKRAEHIKKFTRGQNAKILDIGAGRGVMIQELKKNGWDVYGVLPASQTKDTGANIFYGNLTDANFPAVFFDCVTLFHVLEHLAAPKEALREIFRILKPGGILVMELPNASGVVPRLFKTFWFGYNVPEHLYHFTPINLKHILEEEGFAVMKENFFSLEYSPFVLFQTLLNFFFHDNGQFFESLRTKNSAREISLKKKLSYVAALIFLAPVSFLFSRLTGILKRGDIMTFYCRKP